MANSRPEFKKTILVGLGGAGKLMLTHLKKQFIDMYGVVPPCIKFISLDTDLAPISLRSDDGSQQISLEDREFLYMKVEQPVEFIENSSVKDWFIKPMPTSSIARGAGAVREVGRVAFFFHVPEFEKRIDGLMTQLGDQHLNTRMESTKSEMGASTDFKLSELDPEIYICGSLAGGTGSGTFIDVSILLRDRFQNALIHGFFVLNWIYRNKAFSYRVPGNVYASLCELDNLQSIVYGDKQFVPYSVRYSGHPVVVKKAPFDLVHLIDGRNEYGENIHDVGALCETSATAIFLSVSAMGDAIASVVDNLLAHVSASPRELWQGRYPRYSSFGLSSIYYPAKELHSFLYHREAERLCDMALSVMQEAATDIQLQQKQTEAVTGDVDQFLGDNQLNLLNRAYVQDTACSFPTPINFPVQPFQISDKGFPGMIEFQLEQEEKNLKNQLKQNWEEDGQKFINDTAAALKLKIDAIRQDPALGQADLKSWIEVAVDRLTSQKQAATQDRNTENTNVRDRRGNCDNLKEIAVKSGYLPVIGGSRKKAVANWAAAIVDYLNAVKDEIRYDCEVRFFNAAIEVLTGSVPTSVEADSTIVNALEDAKSLLHDLYFKENENLKLLKSKSNQILVGGGNTVVVSGKSNDAAIVDAITLDFEEFIKDKKIHTPEDYLTAANAAGKDLAGFFLDYSAEKLNHLNKTTVLEALYCIGDSRGDRDAYITEQFNHLFRLSSALWRFDKGRLNLEQREHYDHIVNFGVYEQLEGRENYEPYVGRVKVKYEIRADHAYSTTGDPHRIRLLNFAAALPAFFVQDMDKNKQRYLNEISPTYHVDKYFEMQVPDLFPVSDVANQALRVIGLAIVPGIDVIKDEKLPRGHRFIFDDSKYIEANNNNQPFEWLLFRDMHDEVVYTYDERRQDNLLDVLCALLKERLAALSVDDIHNAIKQYCQKLKDKLNSRDFSRLASARMTHQELTALEVFLDPRGYGMDIDRYIEGRLISD